MRVTAKQYRYPDTRSEYEKKQDRCDQHTPIEISVNRKQRGKVRYV